MIERIVLFGASGDLAARLLIPAVAALVEDELLPQTLEIVGSDIVELTTEEFREHVSEALGEHAAAVAPIARDAVLGMLSYETADVTSPEDVGRVVGTDHEGTLVYLALPSALLERVLPVLAKVGLQGSDSVAIEKPFGTDLASAQRLNEILHTKMPQPTIFRVDHFLSSELVRRVVALRFLNRVFEPTWSSVHVERVDIGWLESLTLEGRASYYDRAGALKDMVQNHLMEAMALVLMEPPARLDADSFRGTRVEALRGVATPSAERVREHTVRARYEAGTIGSRQVPAYVDEPGVDRGRDTETYASVTLEIDSARWADVPFTLRSGKAMARDSAEIAIHFRTLPDYLVDRWPGIEPNVLRIGLMEPYVCLGMMLNAGDREVEARELELETTPSRRAPYANLLLEMLRGDPTLFIRSDEAEEAWRIIDPVVSGWGAGEVPMQTYPAGGPPPGPGAGK